MRSMADRGRQGPTGAAGLWPEAVEESGGSGCGGEGGEGQAETIPIHEECALLTAACLCLCLCLCPGLGGTGLGWACLCIHDLGQSARPAGGIHRCRT